MSLYMRSTSGARSRKSTTGLVASGERRKRFLVVRIGQAAHVEHEIGVERHAVLEAERLEQERELRRVDRDEVLDPAAQRRRRTGRWCRTRSPASRIGASSARSWSIASVSVRSSLRERMAPARLGEALDQRVGLGVEVEEAHVPAERRARRRSPRRARASPGPVLTSSAIATRVLAACARGWPRCRRASTAAGC